MTSRVAFLTTLLTLGPLSLGVFWGCSGRLDVGTDDRNADAGGSVDGTTPNDGNTKDAMISQPRTVAEMMVASCAFPLPAYDGSAPAPGCPCTRRPSPRQEAQCPIGNCTSVTVTIGPAGGTVQLPNSNQYAASGVRPKLVIPANALASDVAITLTELNFSPPGDYVDSSPIYRFEPVDLQLSLAAKFHVGSSNTDPSQDIHAYWSKADLSGWELVPDSVYAGGFVVGTTTRLGLVFAGRTRSAAGVANACP